MNARSESPGALFVEPPRSPSGPLTFRGAADRIYELTRRSDDRWLQAAWSVIGMVLTLAAWTAIGLGHFVRWALMRFKFFKARAGSRDHKRHARLEEARHQELIDELRSVRRALAEANADLQETTEMARVSRLAETGPRRRGRSARGRATARRAR